MGFFNLIETFFFLSLGITFVLILLLVYHFKQRLTSLENKCDTVFEIISNMVQELNTLRQIQQQTMTFRPAFNIPSMPDINRSITPYMTPDEVVEKIKVSEEDFDEDYEEDSDTNSDVDTDSDEDDEEENDAEDDNEEDDDDLPDLIHDTFEVDENATVKIINVSMNEPIEMDVLDTIEIENDNINSDENEVVEPVELNSENEPIHVEKLEDTESLDNNSQDTNELKADSKEVYGKMSVSALKTLVITKGLSSDPSKMKKNELLKLLETSTEN